MEVYLDSSYFEPGKKLVAEINCRMHNDGLGDDFDAGVFYAAICVRERDVIVETDESGHYGNTHVVRERFYVHSSASHKGSAAMYGKCCLTTAVLEIRMPDKFDSRQLCIDCTTNTMRLRRAKHPSLHVNTGRNICFFLAATGSRCCYAQRLKQKPVEIPDSMENAITNSKQKPTQDTTTMKFNPTKEESSQSSTAKQPRAVKGSQYPAGHTLSR
jgi:hypothetical protein